MTNVQRSIIAIGVVAVAGLGSVSGATAKPRPVLKVAPARPTLTTPITVSFKAPKLRRRGVHYGVDMTLGDAGSPPDCFGGTQLDVVLHRARGGMFTATLKPLQVGSGPRKWCDGVARLEVRRHGPGRLYSTVLARRDAPVGTGKAAPPSPVPRLPVKITVLAGSTLTASAAGRPDRSAQLSGVLRGLYPETFFPNTDTLITDVSGSLTPLSGGVAPAIFPPDPLCPDTPPPGTLDAVPASSTLLLAPKGGVTLTLTLAAAPSQLFGCGPAGTLSGTTTLPLSGSTGPKGLAELGLAGSVTGIPLPAGSQGGLAANLVVNVDTSGQP